MPTNGYPGSPRVYQRGAIQIQRGDSGAALSGCPDDDRATFYPGEMIVPSLMAWIEEPGEFACERVEASDMTALELVAE